MSNPPMGTVVSSVMKEESGSEREENEGLEGSQALGFWDVRFGAWGFGVCVSRRV